MSVQFVPLNRLVASAHNARRTDRKADIDELAASIRAHGLLQNLTVAATAADRFQVVAGARRHAALKLLAKAGDIARDFAVPCHVVAEGAAAEASLAENVQRVAMNAMDEMEAFAALIESGLSGENVARRFGCTLRHVEQRLALAALSPRIKAGYRRAELTLDAARAFCIEPDHAKQDSVFKAMSKPISQAASVRANLTQGRMKASDRLVRFVGLEVYEKAGGALVRDMFDIDVAFIADAALITRLADERLELMRADLLGAGWGWVEVNLGNASFSAGAQRVHPNRRAMTRAERKAIADIDAKMAALDQELTAAEEDDPRWEERDQLAACRHSALEANLEWDRDLIAYAGVVVSIDYEGRLSLNSGIVRKADQAKVKRCLLDRERKPSNETDSPHPEERNAESCDSPPPWEGAASPKLSKSLVAELTGARARALRLKVSAHPDLALALAVYAFALRSFTGGVDSTIGLDVRETILDDHEAVESSRRRLASALPDTADALLGWLIDQPREALLDILAIIVAGALDLVHEGASASDQRKQDFADRLASLVDLDMTAFWQADLAFWTRLPKSMLLDALEAAPATIKLPEGERLTLMRAHGKLRKDMLAGVVAQALEGSAWLPEALITPRDGTYVITPDGKSEIALGGMQ